MIVMSRKKNESLVINGNVTVTVVEIRGDKVRLGVAAPKEASVHRQEVWDAIHSLQPTPATPAVIPPPVPPPVRENPPPRPAAQHDRWDARLYDDRHAFVWKHGESLVELLAPRAGESILDLGCGTGHLTARIAATGAEVVGVDSSAAMIAEAREHYPALRFETLDARELAFDGQFDAVFCNAVLHWIKEADKVARGVARALKPGGRFVAELGGNGNVRKLIAGLDQASRAVGAEPPPSPWYYPNIGEYSAVLEAAGLEVTAATLFDRPTPLDGEGGLRNWVEMFGGHYLAAVPVQRRDEFLRHAEEQLRPMLRRDGAWFADYRRLRVVARRAAPSDAPD